MIKNFLKKIQDVFKFEFEQKNEPDHNCCYSRNIPCRCNHNEEIHNQNHKECCQQKGVKMNEN